MTGLIVFAALLIGHALTSGFTQGTPLTAPMVFTTGGLALGVGGVEVLGGDTAGTAVLVLTETALVLVLFTDAVRIDLRTLRSEYHLPLRLLGIGMPLVIVLGTVLGYGILPGLGLAGAALLAAVLAPTDAALSASMVSDRGVPIRIRQTLNVESGLNDGIALPAVMVLAAFAKAQEGVAGSAWSWVGFAAQEIGFGVLAGAAVGGLGGWAIARADEGGWVNATHRRLFPIGIAALSYAGAEAVTGSGILSAFVAGLAYGALAGEDLPFVHQFAEREGELLSMMTFTLFGAMVIGPRLGDTDGWTVLYAVLSLAVVRPLAVAVATVGARLRLETVCFLGWFGPRGLASILFTLLVAEQGGIAAADQIMLVAGVAVLLSVYAHGLTGAPWARSFARRAERYHPTAPEFQDVTVHHYRWLGPRGQDTA